MNDTIKCWMERRWRCNWQVAYLKITSPPVDGATAEYLDSQMTSVNLWGWWVEISGKYASQLWAKYRYTCQVLPKSYDRSISMAAGRKVWKRIMMCVKWNSASRSKRIVTFSIPFSACHHNLRFVKFNQIKFNCSHLSLHVYITILVALSMAVIALETLNDRHYFVRY